MPNKLEAEFKVDKVDVDEDAGGLINFTLNIKTK